MAGTAHTGRELARHVGVAPSTASEHLSTLLDAGLVCVEAQGRNRYFRLASREVATLVETALTLEVTVDPVPPPRVDPGLAFARSCYDHLAGELGVRLYERLVDVGALTVSGDDVALTTAGLELFDRLHIDLPGRTRRPRARRCLDWSQRRDHLAGVAGAGLLAAMLDRGWAHRQPSRPRELRVTTKGRSALATHFEMEIP